MTLTVSLFVFRLIEELTKEIRSKDVLITELREEKTSLNNRVGELEGQVQELSATLLQKDKDVEVIFSWFLFNTLHLNLSKSHVGSFPLGSFCKLVFSSFFYQTKKFRPSNLRSNQ